jgi:hypothetical protein
MVVSLVPGTTMQAAGHKIAMSRILTGAAGLFLGAWGIAVVVDYILPGYLWEVFVVLALILLGLFGKAVYDGRLR